MLRRFRQSMKKMFREFLVYHNSSLEFRAKLITLMIASDTNMDECEEKILNEIAHKIYSDDSERAEILIDAVKEYFVKIKTKNGLDFEHLVILVQREAKENKRFYKKIDTDMLIPFLDCHEDEDEKIFLRRIIDFLEELKKEYGAI